MSKIKSISELCKIVEKAKKKGKNVGLTLGCFDVFHIGHVTLLQSAKKKVDILIVGVANDKSIRISKGKNRPIFPLKERLRLIAELTSVDYILPIKQDNMFNTQEAEVVYEKVIRRLKPTRLITNVLADNHWRNKKRRAKRTGIKFTPVRLKRKSSSTKIVELLEKEF